MKLNFHFPWPCPLISGRLVRRYHRFLADITLDDGRAVTAHCINSGRMEGLVRPGARVWVMPAENPHRTLQWSWEMVEIDGVRIGADTILPNRLVRAMLEARALPGFRSYTRIHAEHRFGTENSRADFLLERGGKRCFIEVKNCHLVYPDGRGYFPDSVSERATKHLHELTRMVAAGHRAVVLFTVQRADAVAVRPSDTHDPAFARAAREAAAAGVRFRALRIRPELDGLHVEDTIPVDLRPYDLTNPRRWKEHLKPDSGWDRPPRTDIMST